MEYNTDRTQLKIPEYGRNVQRMVDYCLTIEDKEHRSKVAQSIIDVIGNLNPRSAMLRLRPQALGSFVHHVRF